MSQTVPTRRPAAIGIAVLAAALAVEFVDELVDGAKGAALPLIRHDLGLSYAQIGLLFSVPLLLGSLIELPVGIAAGYGSRRRRAVALGGIVFVAAVAAMASARSFPVLLVGFVAFFPAAGAFVSLTQAELMDADTGRREHHMAVWTVVGSLGALAGPALVLAVVAFGGSWRIAFLVSAAAGGAALAGIARAGPSRIAAGRSDTVPPPSARDVLDGLRGDGVLRWLALLQVSDLLLDVLTGFVALYVVDVVRAPPAWGAAAVAIRRGSGVLGEAALVPLLDRLPGLSVLATGTVVAGIAYPAFLLVPGLAPKLVALGIVSVGTAPWYPVLQAQLYAALDGHSAVAVTLNSAAGLAGGLAPLAVGLAAQRFGLSAALAGLAVVPIVVLGGLVLRRPLRLLASRKASA